jgi:hypothetical protein
MESASTARKAIRLGIDLGSMTCRAAYLYPGEEKAVIPVPLSLSRFRPVFPIAETIPTTKMYAARYFPGLVQRLIPEFAIRISGEIQTAAELTQSILEQVIDAGRAYAGAPVEGALVAYPAWLDPAGQDILREAASRPDQATAQIVCGPECMCAHFQAREMSRRTVPRCWRSRRATRAWGWRWCAPRRGECGCWRSPVTRVCWPAT